MFNINKNYHFYAGHRNEQLNDKCRNLHGHTYHVECVFEFESAGKGNVTLLFSDIDKEVEPIIKQYDHALLMHTKDPLLAYIRMYEEQMDDVLKIRVFENPTSVEELCLRLSKEILETGLPLIKITVRETLSSSVTLILK